VLLASTAEEVQVEMQRLSERVKMLKAADANVASIKLFFLSALLFCAACRHGRRNSC
jgi:hypothetical protein